MMPQGGQSAEASASGRKRKADADELNSGHLGFSDLGNAGELCMNPSNVSSFGEGLFDPNTGQGSGLMPEQSGTSIEAWATDKRTSIVDLASAEALAGNARQEFAADWGRDSENGGAVEEAGFSDDESDPLRHATVLTQEQLLQRRIQRLRQLRQLYKMQYWALLAEMRSKYRRFYLRHGRGGWLERDNGQAQAPGDASVGQGGSEAPPESQPSPSEQASARKPAGGANCIVPGCMGRPLAPSAYCFRDILQDPKQCLYKPCAFKLEDRSACGAPALGTTVMPVSCTLHAPPQTQMGVAVRKDTKAGTTSAPPPKLQDAIHQYVKVIQKKRHAQHRQQMQQQQQQQQLLLQQQQQRQQQQQQRQQQQQQQAAAYQRSQAQQQVQQQQQQHGHGGTVATTTQLVSGMGPKPATAAAPGMPPGAQAAPRPAVPHATTTQASPVKAASPVPAVRPVGSVAAAPSTAASPQLLIPAAGVAPGAARPILPQAQPVPQVRAAMTAATSALPMASATLPVMSSSGAPPAVPGTAPAGIRPAMVVPASAAAPPAASSSSSGPVGAATPASMPAVSTTSIMSTSATHAVVTSLPAAGQGAVMSTGVAVAPVAGSSLGGIASQAASTVPIAGRSSENAGSQGSKPTAAVAAAAAAPTAAAAAAAAAATVSLTRPQGQAKVDPMPAASVSATVGMAIPLTAVHAPMAVPTAERSGAILPGALAASKPSSGSIEAGLTQPTMAATAVTSNFVANAVKLPMPATTSASLSPANTGVADTSGAT